ncbi:MAG: hypothetical protein AB1567_05180 [bacterium]
MGLSYLEILGIYLSSAGTLASILGIFFAIYAKQNGRITREFIRELHEESQEFLKKMDERTAKMDDHLVKMDEHAGERHKEVIAVLCQLKQK